MTLDTLANIHNDLCHPGITRLSHFIRTRNLPYSLEDVKRIVNNCAVCAKVRPQFVKPNPVQLIKATQPFER